MTGRGAAAAAIAAMLLLAVPAARAEDAPEKAQACAGCHGDDGNSPAPNIPSLAGQQAQYLATQLYLFREGGRKNELMAPVAAELTNQDMNTIAAWFTQQNLKPPKSGPDPAQAPAAQALIEQNRCASCHGPDFAGVQQMPRLAGQKRVYLAAQLSAFKTGTRTGVDGTMASAAQPLSDADIDVLAAYLAGLGAR